MENEQAPNFWQGSGVCSEASESRDGSELVWVPHTHRASEHLGWENRHCSPFLTRLRIDFASIRERSAGIERRG